MGKYWYLLFITFCVFQSLSPSYSLINEAHLTALEFHYFFMICYFQAQLVYGTFILVVFSLLPNKSSDTYLRFFREVAKLADNMFQGKFKVLHPCKISAADPDPHGTPVTNIFYNKVGKVEKQYCGIVGGGVKNIFNTQTQTRNWSRNYLFLARFRNSSVKFKF